ncbi:MAG: DUF1674 domain-containing protein [Kiloniellales bacterium]|nr:DUF1674 domain-containing protein [Kiloniellales bacterium]
MARTFKMHRVAPGRQRSGAGIAPLGSRADKTAGRDRLAGRQGAKPAETAGAGAPVEEIGGPEGPEPTRYGDWEKNGICYDF